MHGMGLEVRHASHALQLRQPSSSILAKLTMRSTLHGQHQVECCIVHLFKEVALCEADSGYQSPQAKPYAAQSIRSRK